MLVLELLQSLKFNGHIVIKRKVNFVYESVCGSYVYLSDNKSVYNKNQNLKFLNRLPNVEVLESYISEGILFVIVAKN